MALPSHRALLTSLLVALSAPSAELHRQVIATLDAIFPAILIPALNLLDQGLVIRILSDSGCSRGTYHVRSSSYVAVKQQRLRKRQPQSRLLRSGGNGQTGRIKGPIEEDEEAEEDQDEAEPAATTRRYLVRLAAWSCTCPAFAVDAFPRDDEVFTRGSIGHSGGPDEPAGPEFGYGTFGGLSRDGIDADGEDVGEVPCCKHILACALAKHWPNAGALVKRLEITGDEMAGIAGAV